MADDQARLNDALLRNIKHGINELERRDLIEGDVRLDRALGVPWFQDSEDPTTEVCHYPPRVGRQQWRAVMEALAAIQISKLSYEYAALTADRCQSALEEALFLALVLSANVRGIDVVTPSPGYERAIGCCRQPTDDGRRVLICPQHHIGEVHVDLYLRYSEPYPYELENGKLVTRYASDHLLVEVDGHDFHEKTKEQAARDKKRDRELQKLGFPVFRYTGSEVWKDPFEVARDILRTLVRNTTGDHEAS